MRILILGGDGMLGHRLSHHFGGEHEVAVTLRKPRNAYQLLSTLSLPGGIYDGVPSDPRVFAS